MDDRLILQILEAFEENERYTVDQIHERIDKAIDPTILGGLIKALESIKYIDTDAAGLLWQITTPGLHEKKRLIRIKEYIPGTGLSNPDRQKIIDKCLEILKQDRFANIKWAADHFLKMEIKYLDDAVIIASRISENAKYNWAFSQKDGWPYLFINPAYSLTKMQKLGIISTFVLTAAMVFIQWSNLRIIKANRDSQKELQQQITTLQQQVQRLQQGPPPRN